MPRSYKLATERRRKMTARQKAYRSNRLLGMNMYNAARAAGYSENMARTACREIEPVAGIADIVDQAGATDKVIAEALVKIALTATKLQNVNIKLTRDSEGNLQVQDTDDFIELPDNFARLQALKQICDLKGTTKNKGEKDGGSLETFFIELIKNRKVCFEKGEGLKITRVEHSALNRFMAKPA